LEEGENKHIIHLGKENDLDERSVFVKNVHFSATEAEIREHFQECGEIKRVTILHDKMAN
jgi:RNA recognition motif-containing protein